MQIGKFIKVICVQEAYDEPIYEWNCNGCGMGLAILNFPIKM